MFSLGASAPAPDNLDCQRRMQSAAPYCKFAPDFLAVELPDSDNSTGLFWHTLLPLFLMIISSELVFPTFSSLGHWCMRCLDSLHYVSMIPLNLFRGQDKCWWEGIGSNSDDLLSWLCCSAAAWFGAAGHRAGKSSILSFPFRPL